MDYVVEDLRRVSVTKFMKTSERQKMAASDNAKGREQ